MSQSIHTLIKLQKLLVDEQRLVLAALQDNLMRIDMEISELLVQQAREEQAAQSAAPEAAHTYAAFIKAMIDRARMLHQARLDAAHQVDEAHAKLAMLFEEQKRYEIIRDKRAEEAAAAERMREQAAFDETSVIAFERKQRDR